MTGDYEHGFPLRGMKFQVLDRKVPWTNTQTRLESVLTDRGLSYPALK